MVQRVYIISSSWHFLKEEIKPLEDVLVTKNNFPIWVVKKILKERNKRRKIIETMKTKKNILFL